MLEENKLDLTSTVLELMTERHKENPEVGETRYQEVKDRIKQMRDNEEDYSHILRYELDIVDTEERHLEMLSD